MTIQTWTCCLCGEPGCTGYGNNPAPLKPSDERCCDACNSLRVIPERVRRLNDSWKDDGYWGDEE